MLPERGMSYCGHVVTALFPYFGSLWCLGTAHEQKCCLFVYFFLEYSKICSAAESSARVSSQTPMGLPRGSPQEVPAGLGSAELDSDYQRNKLRKKFFTMRAVKH